jgi:hypothetical protein
VHAIVLEKHVASSSDATYAKMLVSSMAHVIITLAQRWANLGVYKLSKNLGNQFHGENPQQLGNMKQNN